MTTKLARPLEDAKPKLKVAQRRAGKIRLAKAVKKIINRLQRMRIGAEVQGTTIIVTDGDSVNTVDRSVSVKDGIFSTKEMLGFIREILKGAEFGISGIVDPKMEIILGPLALKFRTDTGDVPRDLEKVPERITAFLELKLARTIEYLRLQSVQNGLTLRQNLDLCGNEHERVVRGYVGYNALSDITDVLELEDLDDIEVILEGLEGFERFRKNCKRLADDSRVNWRRTEALRQKFGFVCANERNEMQRRYMEVDGQIRTDEVILRDALRYLALSAPEPRKNRFETDEAYLRANCPKLYGIIMRDWRIERRILRRSLRAKIPLEVVRPLIDEGLGFDGIQAIYLASLEDDDVGGTQTVRRSKTPRPRPEVKRRKRTYDIPRIVRYLVQNRYGGSMPTDWRGRIIRRMQGTIQLFTRRYIEYLDMPQGKRGIFDSAGTGVTRMEQVSDNIRDGWELFSIRDEGNRCIIAIRPGSREIAILDVYRRHDDYQRTAANFNSNQITGVTTIRKLG